jgi:hypothetical protein
MKILQRLKNIWKLGEYEESKPFLGFSPISKTESGQPIQKMAQIIKRKLSIDEEVNKILQDDN